MKMYFKRKIFKTREEKLIICKRRVKKNKLNSHQNLVKMSNGAKIGVSKMIRRSNYWSSSQVY